LVKRTALFTHDPPFSTRHPERSEGPAKIIAWTNEPHSSPTITSFHDVIEMMKERTRWNATGAYGSSYQ
jgi:hypothetical protein